MMKEPQMDSSETESETEQKDVKPKLAPKNKLSIKQKKILVNVYNYLEKTCPTYPSKMELYQITSNIMQVSVGKVRSTIKSFKETQEMQRELDLLHESLGMGTLTTDKTIKWKVPKMMSVKDQRYIVNIYRYFEKNCLTYPYKMELYQITSEIAEVSVGTIRLIMRNYRQRQEMPDPESPPGGVRVGGGGGVVPDCVQVPEAAAAARGGGQHQEAARTRQEGAPRARKRKESH